MESPSLTPQSIVPYFSIDHFETLILQLTIHPSDLLPFIEAITTDETWCTHHPEFVAQFFKWLTGHVLNRGISLGDYERLASAIRSHYENLVSYLPADVTMQFKDDELTMNSMILCFGSSYFQEKITKESSENQRIVLKFPSIQRNQFLPMLVYMTTGKFTPLATAAESYLIEINHLAKQWRIEGVVSETERLLCKYVAKERAVTYLIQALKEKWVPVAETAANQLNQNEDGYTWIVLKNSQLRLVVEKLSIRLQEILSLLKEWVVELRLTNILVGNTQTLSLINQLPSLELLDLSNTDEVPTFIEDLPSQIQKLILAECHWITRKTLHQFNEACPHLQQLSLANNNLLPDSCWGEIFSFKNLKSLDLSGCYQIENKDLILLLKGSTKLETLLLNRCTEISEKGFLELARKGKNFINLGLSRCPLTEQSFMEIAVNCRSLIFLDVSYCQAITEKGILELVKNALELKELILTRTSLNLYRDRERAITFFERLHKQKPGLKIILEGNES